jgi:peroxiredoxin
MITELTIDPESTTVVQAEWRKSGKAAESQVAAYLKIAFDSFRIGEPIAPSEFTFDPPAGAKETAELPIQGFSKSQFVGKPAPDFSDPAAAGETLRLANLRGRTVVIAFWSTACAPCRQTLTALAEVQSGYKDKGLVVLAFGNESLEAMAGYPGSARVLTIPDAGGRVRREYQARILPTVFIVSPEGQVVDVLRGALSPNTLREALRAAGL